MKLLKVFIVLVFIYGCVYSQSQTNPYFQSKYTIDSWCGVLAEINPKPNLKNMLIIGDSISMNYTPHLRLLVRDYNIYHNPCNGASSGHGLYYIDRYLALPKYDLILFNHGIWENMESMSVEEYKYNLTNMIKKMRGRASRIVFLTTTVISGYNENHAKDLRSAAFEVMKAEKVEVMDLYYFSKAIKDKQFDGIHLDDFGNMDLAYFIMKGIYSYETP